MSKRFAILGNLLIATISIAFALTAVEIGLRIANRFGPVADGASQDAQLFALSDNEEIIFEHVPNVRVEFPDGRGNPGWQISTDENALRRNGKVSDSEAEIRGICIGDSIVFGAGLSDHETIPARLSVIVSNEIGRSFECLNFGVSNYTTAQEAAYFRHKQALRYEPKIVVLGALHERFQGRPWIDQPFGGESRTPLTGCTDRSHRRIVPIPHNRDARVRGWGTHRLAERTRGCVRGRTRSR